MASLNSHNYSTTTTTTTLLIVLLLHHLLSPISCINNQPQPPISPRELLSEEENRLGSMPPSCHNKCNECHPCMPVQVPTLPGHDRVQVQPGLTRAASMEGNSNRYSNYKPLGWKCHCRGHFFNP